ncbi:GAF and ANTAR domain-containing protein [Rhodococcoides kyotonense]|uniref:GAF domain-containing protein n=1 Tax=Rhodococcoides kyotonense TaxID=398843 RepID=A0A239MYV7_9NOCA|nr:GAF and ANTAR domain-containing protein [Rhodococcus kyotonensis]SNT47413.1 GAF domain-containing protein [Rhodococcus kyotonensis]
MDIEQRDSGSVDLSLLLAEAARGFFRPRSVDDTLVEVTRAVTTVIEAADCADVLVVAGRTSFTSHAATNDLPLRLDSLQETLQEGPCVDAARRGVLVRCDDFATDPRWPRFGPEAAKIGVHSGLSFQLYTGDDTLGALNVFAAAPHAFDDRDEELGAVFATHAAMALYTANKSEQFESALASRDLIGQAKGMLIERYSIDSVQAFALLVKISQDANVSVATLADRLVALGSESGQRA